MKWGHTTYIGKPIDIDTHEQVAFRLGFPNHRHEDRISSAAHRFASPRRLGLDGSPAGGEGCIMGNSTW